MKKDSSFFVVMDPPEDKDARRKEREARISEKRLTVDETYMQSLNWQELINDEPDPAERQPVDLRSKYFPNERERPKRTIYASGDTPASVTESPEELYQDSMETGNAACEDDIPDYENPDEPDIYDRVAHEEAGHEEAGQEEAGQGTASQEHTGKRIHFKVPTPEVRKIILIVRLAAASLMFAAAVLSGSLSGFSLPLLIFSFVVAGADLAVDAVQCLVSRILYSPSVIVLLTFTVSFVIGFRQEAAAAMILYQISSLLVSVFRDIVSHSAIRLVDIHESGIRDRLTALLQEEGVDYINTQSAMRHSVIGALVPVILLAVLYAVLVPVISYYRVNVAVHRAAVVIFLCTPASVLYAMPVVGRMGLCAAASSGTVFRNASALEQVSSCRTLIFDKSGLFNPPEEKVKSLYSDRLDQDTLTNLVYHLTYSSKQPFAKAVRNTYECTYDSSLLSDFTEEIGGVSGTLSGTTVMLGTESYLIRNGQVLTEKLRTDLHPGGTIYFLFIAGQYGGELMVSDDEYGDISDVLHDFRMEGINKCILITEDSAEETATFAELNGFDEVYAGIDSGNKKALLDELCTAEKSGGCILTADSTVAASFEKDSVIYVGEDSGDADAATAPHHFTGISRVFPVSRRIKQLAVENALIAVAVKAVLIFLSLTGYCNLWMAVTGETAAVIFTVFNSRRVSSRSLIGTFMDPGKK